MQNGDSANTHKVEILECTIRDGNYAVDFKFSTRDTDLLTQELAALGFKWIEIGHGLGLGAARAGKGEMPDSDEALIRNAREVAGRSLLGMFFIPGIGTHDDLKMAADAGLNFVRIGYNAHDLKTAFPYVETARSLGLIPCINMMKSYAISSKQFAEYSLDSFKAGAEVVYCVDSAGCMLPEQISEYFKAAKEYCSSYHQRYFGFHGHNNLMLGIANCLAAYKAGATFIDTTLYGLGRSAGNAQTEVLVAVLDKMGVPTGIDLFKLMDVAERLMWPLVSQTRMHSMMSVAIGYGSFHTSFLPKVADAAKRHNADLKRMVAAMGRINPNQVEDASLEKTAKEFANTGERIISDKIIEFQRQDFGKNSIRLGKSAVKDLVDGMNISSAKRPGSRTMLCLIPTGSKDTLIPDFIYADRSMVLGELGFGSTESLIDCIKDIAGSISLFLIDNSSPLGKDALNALAAILGPSKVCAVNDTNIKMQFLSETLCRAIGSSGSILVYGCNAIVAQAIERANLSQQTFVFGNSQNIPGATCISTLEDFSHVKMDFDLILLTNPPRSDDTRRLFKALGNGGQIISLCHVESSLEQPIITLDLRHAYAGFLERYLCINRALGEPLQYDTGENQ